MDKIEDMLRRALDRVDASNPIERHAIYDRIRSRFDQSPAASSPQSAIIRQRLEDLIGKIEASYAAGPSAPATDVTAGPRPELSKETFVNDQTTTSQGKAASPIAILAAAVAVAIAAGAGWYAFGRASPIDAEFDGVGGGFAVNLQGTPIKAGPDGPFAFNKVDGTGVITVTGPATIATIEPLKIDTSKTYAMKIRARVVKDDPGVGGSNFLAGFATFDAQGKLQSDAPGSHRYFVSTGKLSVADGWRDLEGTITGAGNDSHSMFRVGTDSAKPVILVNFDSPGAVTEIDYIRFKECENPQDCKLDAQ